MQRGTTSSFPNTNTKPPWTSNLPEHLEIFYWIRSGRSCMYLCMNERRRIVETRLIMICFFSTDLHWIHCRPGIPSLPRRGLIPSRGSWNCWSNLCWGSPGKFRYKVDLWMVIVLIIINNAQYFCSTVPRPGHQKRARRRESKTLGVYVASGGLTSSQT